MVRCASSYVVSDSGCPRTKTAIDYRMLPVCGAENASLEARKMNAVQRIAGSLYRTWMPLPAGAGRGEYSRLER